MIGYARKYLLSAALLALLGLLLAACGAGGPATSRSWICKRPLTMRR